MPPNRRLRAPTLGLALLLVLTACGEPPEEARSRGGEGPAPGEPAPDRADARADARTDTIRIEGMPEPISLRLYRAPDDFPLPFTAYVPEDMAPAADASESTAHFTAEFGGVRNEDAFMHLYVFPAGMDGHQAIAAARGYDASRGVPVSKGLEPIADGGSPPHLDWALESYRFRYQTGGEWFGGTIAVGRQDRYFLIMRHYPVEFAEGFGPRADLITETWRWADGSGLEPGPRPEPPPVVQERPDPEP